jgi:hypothetical protein
VIHKKYEMFGKEIMPKVVHNIDHYYASLYMVI